MSKISKKTNALGTKSGSFRPRSAVDKGAYRERKTAEGAFSSSTSHGKIHEQTREGARRRAQAALDAMTDSEDAEITAAALADPDAQPVDDLIRRRGRPMLPPERKKVPVLLKLDPDVVERFKAEGSGWQTRMNAALRKAAGLKG